MSFTGRTDLTRRESFVRGVLAGGVALAILLAGRLVTGRPGFLEAVSDGFLRFVPLSVFDAAVAALGPLAKGTLYSGIAVAIPLAGGLLALNAVRFPPRGRSTRSAVVAVLLIAAAAFFLAAVVALPLFGAGILGSDLRADAWALQVPLALAALAYGIVIIGFRQADTRDAAAAGQIDSEADPATNAAGLPRRSFLGRALAILGIASLAGSGLAVLDALLRTSRPLTGGGPSADASAAMDPFGPTPGLTPVADFYQISKNLLPVRVDGATWRLRIDGLVDQPADVTLEALRAMPSLVAYRTLECISDDVPAGDDLIGNQRWRGVRIRDLVDGVGVQATATDVLWEAADGYTESVPLEVALHDDSWIAFEMDDAPLTAEHGFPARVFIAGRFGMKQPKWVTRLQLADHDEPGYWEQRGWDRDAFVVTMSRIDRPRAGDTVRVGESFMAYGVANSGDRGISHVELSPDDGATWLEAELEDVSQPPLGPLTWVRWRVAVSIPQQGARRLVVRATDGSGTVQESALRAPLPAGSTGWHAVRIAVAA